MGLSQACEDGHVSRKWRSQPLLKKIQAGDILISVNTVLSGNHFAKISELFRFSNIGFPSQSMYLRYNTMYTYPVIDKYWVECQEKTAAKLRQKEWTVLAGRYLLLFRFVDRFGDPRPFSPTVGFLTTFGRRVHGVGQTR